MVATRSIADVQSPRLISKYPPRRTLIIAGKGILPQDLSDGNYVSVDTRMALRNGNLPASNIRFLFANWYVGSDGNELSDLNGNNDITVRAALEIGTPNTTSGTVRPLTFGGRKAGVIEPEAPYLMTDPADLTLPGGKLFALRSNANVSSGQKFPQNYVLQTGSFNSATDFNIVEGGVQSNGAADAAVYSAGALGTAVNTGMPILGVLGDVDAERGIAVGIWGDSLGRGVGDSAGGGSIVRGGGLGYIARGLVLPIGTTLADGSTLSKQVMVPYANCSKGGMGVVQYAIPVLSGLEFRRRMWATKYVTHAITNLGTNDMPSSVDGNTLNTFKGYYRTWWQMLRDRGIRHVTQCCIMPRVSGTYTNPALQTPVSISFQPGGLRDQLNDWFLDLADGEIDDVVDPNPYVEDQTIHGVYAAPGGAALVGDGVHLNAAGAQLAHNASFAWAVRNFSAYAAL